jgi:hypothetical protein
MKSFIQNTIPHPDHISDDTYHLGCSRTFKWLMSINRKYHHTWLTLWHMSTGFRRWKEWFQTKLAAKVLVVRDGALTNWGIYRQFSLTHPTSGKKEVPIWKKRQATIECAIWVLFYRLCMLSLSCIFLQFCSDTNLIGSETKTWPT